MLNLSEWRNDLSKLNPKVQTFTPPNHLSSWTIFVIWFQKEANACKSSKWPHVWEEWTSSLTRSFPFFGPDNSPSGSGVWLARPACTGAGQDLQHVQGHRHVAQRRPAQRSGSTQQGTAGMHNCYSSLTSSFLLQLKDRLSCRKLEEKTDDPIWWQLLVSLP